LLDPPAPSWARPRRAKDLRASPQRRPGTPPRTGASPDRTRPARPPKPSGSGRPATRSTRRLLARSAASRMKTLLRTVPMRRLAPAPRGPSASVTFTNSLHPINQHRPDAGAAGAGPARPAAPDPGTKPGLPRMPWPDDRSRRIEDRRQRAAIAA